MLIAIGIFVAFYFVVMDVWPLSARAARQARNVMVASNLAHRELEYSMYQGYDAVTSRSGTLTVQNTVNGSAQRVTFGYSVQVTASGTDTKDVVVTVEWTDPGATPSQSVQRRIQMETLLGNV